ncbi:uncharacterized protein LOC141527471 isoform X2 [Cotesia typhae]|uniref:uncharacterized protein LOC141527471 isoform X2 n=1 Tax=Cotesia typhae TaxID=2053667 RepID=UPI003D69E95F
MICQICFLLFEPSDPRIPESCQKSSGKGSKRPKRIVPSESDSHYILVKKIQQVFLSNDYSRGAILKEFDGYCRQVNKCLIATTINLSDNCQLDSF